MFLFIVQFSLSPSMWSTICLKYLSNAKCFIAFKNYFLYLKAWHSAFRWIPRESNEYTWRDLKSATYHGGPMTMMIYTMLCDYSYMYLVFTTQNQWLFKQIGSTHSCFLLRSCIVYFDHIKNNAQYYSVF